MRFYFLGLISVLYSTHLFNQNVAINTDGSTGSTLLHIKDDGSTNSIEDIFRVENSPSGAASNGIGAEISFHIKDGTGTSEEQATISVEMEDISSNSEDASLSFKINQGGTIREIIRIDGSDGSVGIGSSEPTQALDVNGTITATNFLMNGNYWLPAGDGTSNQVITTNGSGSLSWTDLSDLFRCPTGFTEISNGTRTLGCIETDEADYSGNDATDEASDETSWYNAQNYCFTEFGGRLPSYSEWYISLNNFALTNETDDYEWLSNSQESWAGLSNQVRMMSAGDGAITTSRGSTPGSSLAFRCWLPFPE